MIQSLMIFLLSGVCEIGGGYLIWLWLKEGKSPYLALCGCALLILYGVVATWQNASFGRVYAAYGGIFIAMSVAWAFLFDGFKPDMWDIIGTCVALLGVLIIMYAPR